MNKNELGKLGFKTLKDIKEFPRIIMSIAGLEKQGKTHFAMTAPGPIALFSTDIGEEGVLSKFTHKEIHVLDVAQIKEGMLIDQAQKEWERFKAAYLAILRDGDFRTIVLDTATEIWELLRMARFGKLSQVMPHQYGPVNSEYRHLIREAYGFNKNVILLHKMKALYVNDKRTADYERSGFSDTGFLVQINARAYRYNREDGGEFALYITDCRQNPDLAEEEFTGAMCSFPFLASMALPEIDPKVWE